MIDGEPTMTDDEIVEMAHRLMHAKDQLATKYNKVRELVSGKNVEEVCDNILALKSALNRTKRALWLARAERAEAQVRFYAVAQISDGVTKWTNVECKCRAYADKFKEE